VDADESDWKKHLKEKRSMQLMDSVDKVMVVVALYSCVTVGETHHNAEDRTRCDRSSLTAARTSRGTHLLRRYSTASDSVFER